MQVRINRIDKIAQLRALKLPRSMRNFLSPGELLDRYSVLREPCPFVNFSFKALYRAGDAPQFLLESAIA